MASTSITEPQGGLPPPKNRLSDDKSFEKVVTAEDIDQLFQLLLGRSVGGTATSDEYIKRRIDNRFSVAQMITELRNSREMAKQFAANQAREYAQKSAVGNAEFRIPSHLVKTPPAVSKVILVGSCLMDGWEAVIRSANPAVSAHRVLFNNASALPAIDETHARSVDFQILQIPIRSVLPEGLYFGLSYNDAEGFREAFAKACVNLERNLEAGLAYNTGFGMVTYVANLLTPIQNDMGRASARYSLNNMVFFIEELNRHLSVLMEKYSNVYLLDIEQIVSTLGKRYIQDDFVTHSNHGSFMGDAMGGAEGRLEPAGSLREIYGPKRTDFILAIFNEAVASYRSLRQTDSVKLVIFDLDDTLWNGVAAEEDLPGPHMIEGWPLGILEAVSYLWRRGILIALCSKNENANIVRIWNALYGSRFPLDNFVTYKINWNSKADNVKDIIAEVSLLPSSVLFVDDNPAERALVKQALPGIRTIELPLAEWKRVLLWSAETQSIVITKESVNRTETVKAQIKRVSAESTLSRADYLASLRIKMAAYVVNDCADGRYARSFELINKTNQFNTTGRRWTPIEVGPLFKEGGYFVCTEMEDLYANYGLISVVVVNGRVIEQFVLSCRVFGMDVEYAILYAVCRRMYSQHGLDISARLIETGRNALCLDLYQKMNFKCIGSDEWGLCASDLQSLPDQFCMINIDSVIGSRSTIDLCANTSISGV